VAVIVSYPGEKRGAGIFAEKPGGTRRPGLQKTAETQTPSVSSLGDVEGKRAVGR